MPKFLIIRFSSIGDIVLTTPVIRCLKKQVSNAEVHFLTKSGFSEILSGNPYIDQVHILGSDKKTLLSKLKSIKFDGVIDLHHNYRSWQFKRVLDCPSYSFHKLNIQKWLLVNFKINKLPNVHIVDRYLDALSFLQVKNDGQGLDFFIQSDALTIINTLPLTHQQDYTALVIAAKHATKRLPENKIIELCKELNSPIVLLGGKEDKEQGDLISKEVGNLVYSACGKTSLHESAALIKYAKNVITHDTGLMHIAAALQKKMISIWGNTIPEFGMYPYYSNSNDGMLKGLSTVVEVENLSCRPCSKIGFEKCPKGHLDCLNKIDNKKIIEKLNAGL